MTGRMARSIQHYAKVSQETLAGMIGTTQSHVSFFMNKFRKLAFIEYNGAGYTCAAPSSVLPSTTRFPNHFRCVGAIESSPGPIRRRPLSSFTTEQF
jgi:hypothetical protein